MAWKVSGRSLDLCSCKMWCPCWLGPEIEPDEGWCAHTFGYEIQQGNSDGVELSGTTVALTGEWPANFYLGGGKARLYIGQATMRPLSDGAGKSTIVSGAMSQAGLQIDSMNLASSEGSQWSDPDFRSWEGSSGNIHEFDWSN